MKKFEYKVFNVSSLAKDKLESRFDPKPAQATKGPKTWLDAFNEMGSQGWEFTLKLTDASYLFKREVTMEDTLQRFGACQYNPAGQSTGGVTR